MTEFAEYLLNKDKRTVVAPEPPAPAPAPATTAVPPPVPTTVSAEKPVEKLSISEAAEAVGTSRDTVYRLYKAGFIKGWMPSPKNILLDAADLRAFLEESAQAGFWTRERKVRFNGKGQA